MTDAQIVEALKAEYIKYVGQTENKGPNRSRLIDKINRFVGVALGSPYCLSGLQFGAHEVEKQLQLNFDLPVMAHCQTFYKLCASHLKHQTPKAGDWGLYRYAGRSSGHAVFVYEVLNDKQIKTVEFNTGPEKWMNRNGDGVYMKTRNISGSGLMKLMGFVRVPDSVNANLVQA